MRQVKQDNDCSLYRVILRAFDLFAGDVGTGELTGKCNAAICSGLAGAEASSPACPGRIMLEFQHNRPAALSGGRAIQNEASQSHART